MKRFCVIIFHIFLISKVTFSYRYICNSLLADGQEKGDECGLCDDETAPRWDDPNIAVRVDFDNRPEGISLSDWIEVVDNSFKAWNDIKGSSLKFSNIRGESKREFGTNEYIHEIFWITDPEDWRRKVGAGEFGTLGATLPRYSCSNEQKSKRQIFDADLVLNGLPYINWQKDCDPEEDCISIQTTLVHELGHFFGLDHACLMCADSIMSARAGYDIKFPLFDDIKALITLYPDGEEGQFGFSCQTDLDCSDGFSCIYDGENNYCSNRCNSDKDCGNGLGCETVNNENFCVFMGTKMHKGKMEGQNCSLAPCLDPYICAGPSIGNFHCFLPCQNKNDCPESKSCVGLTKKISICVLLKEKNDQCDYQNLCADDLICVFENPKNGICRETCKKDKQGGFYCQKGESCQFFLEGEKICAPDNLSISLQDGTQGFKEPNAPKSPNTSKEIDDNNRKNKSNLNCSMSNSHEFYLLFIVFYYAYKRFFYTRIK